MKDIKNLGIKTKEGFEVKNLKRFPSMEWGDEGGLQADIYYKGNYILQLYQAGEGGCAVTYSQPYYREHQQEINEAAFKLLQRTENDVYGPNAKYAWMAHQNADQVNDDDWESIVINMEVRQEEIANIKDFLKKNPTVVICRDGVYDRYIGYKRALLATNPKDIDVEKRLITDAVKIYVTKKYPDVKFIRFDVYSSADLPTLKTI